MLNRLSADPIPNIRFNVAKTYKELIKVLRRLPNEGTVSELDKSGQSGAPSAKGRDIISTQVLPDLEKLQQDEDVDVRYFATDAMGSSGERMEMSP